MAAGIRPAGRPRDERATRAILEVTLRHLGRRGYAGLSLDAIAEDAGVTKPTLYRRWASKADLVTAAVADWRNRSMPPVTGDFKADLEANLRQVGHLLGEPLTLALIAALLLHERSQPRLMDLYRERNVVPREDALRKALLSAWRAGALDPSLDIDTVIAMVIGAYYWKLIAGESIPAKWPAQIMDVIFKEKRKR